MELTMKLKNIIVSGSIGLAGLVGGFAIGHPWDNVEAYGVEMWDDGYMNGYYHGADDESQGIDAPSWLEDLRMD